MQIPEHHPLVDLINHFTKRLPTHRHTHTHTHTHTQLLLLSYSPWLVRYCWAIYSWQLDPYNRNQHKQLYRQCSLPHFSPSPPINTHSEREGEREGEGGEREGRERGEGEGRGRGGEREGEGEGRDETYHTAPVNKSSTANIHHAFTNISTKNNTRTINKKVKKFGNLPISHCTLICSEAHFELLLSDRE